MYVGRGGVKEVFIGVDDAAQRPSVVVLANRHVQEPPRLHFLPVIPSGHTDDRSIGEENAGG